MGVYELSSRVISSDDIRLSYILACVYSLDQVTK